MQILTFLLNGIKFGIPVGDIQSVEANMEVVNIPNSLPQISGIINLHGEIVAVYSLAEQFHYPKQEIGNIIVVQAGNIKCGLEVEKVDSIIDVADGQVVSLSDIMKNDNSCFNVTEYDEKLIVLLETAALIPEKEQERIKELVIEKQEIAAQT